MEFLNNYIAQNRGKIIASSLIGLASAATYAAALAPTNQEALTNSLPIALGTFLLSYVGGTLLQHASRQRKLERQRKANRPPAPDFSEWNKDNPCVDCGGGCCHDVRIQLSDIANIPIQQRFGNLLKNVVNPTAAMDQREVPKENGVYFVAGNRHTYIEIVGNCPELNTEDGTCNSHDGPRPLGCITSTTENSPVCFDRRPKKNDLIQIEGL